MLKIFVVCAMKEMTHLPCLLDLEGVANWCFSLLAWLVTVAYAKCIIQRRIYANLQEKKKRDSLMQI